MTEGASSMFVLCLLQQVGGIPGMAVPMKRQALDTKAGIPMFNPAAAYPHLAYAQPGAAQPAYVPVSCKYISFYYC